MQPDEALHTGMLPEPAQLMAIEVLSQLGVSVLAQTQEHSVTTYELYPQSGGVEITPQYVCSMILGVAQNTCQSQISYISNSGTVSSNGHPALQTSPS